MRDEVTVFVKELRRIPVDGLRLTGEGSEAFVFVEWGKPPRVHVGFLWKVEVADLLFGAPAWLMREEVI